MKMKKALAVLGAVILTLNVSGLIPDQAAGEQIYEENEWHFADGSMDVSGGIPADAEGALAKILQSGVLRVATEPNNAPFSYIDSARSGQDQYAGADMELARRIAERMGVELKIIEMDYTQVLPAVSENLCDLTISAVSYTPARAAAYTLSKGYYFPEGGSRTVFVVREDNLDQITDGEDLEHRVLVARSGSLQEALVIEQIRSYREFHRAASIQTVYEAVIQGKAFVGIVDETSALNYFRTHPDCGLALTNCLAVQPDEHYLGYRVAVKKGELQLAYFVNGVIDEVLESGEYLKWIGNAQ